MVLAQSDGERGNSNVWQMVGAGLPVTALSEIWVPGGGPRSITTRLRHSATLGHNVALSERVFGTCEFAVHECTAGEGWARSPIGSLSQAAALPAPRHCQRSSGEPARNAGCYSRVKPCCNLQCKLSAALVALLEWPWIWRLGFKHHA